MKKGDVIEDIVVETMASEGKCVARVNGLVIFLEGGAPGDVVDARLTRIKSSFLEGKVTAIKSLSARRTEPFCSHFGTCGGCSWQHIDYDTQLQYKQKQVTDNLERIGGLQLPALQTILPSKNTRFYRNKLDYTFSAQPKAVRFGVVHVEAPDVAERVRTALVAAHRPRDCFVSLATGVLGTHVGQGAWALCWQVEDGTPTRPTEGASTG